MALNLIDWFALIFTFWFQYLLFSKDQHLTKKLINFSGIFVYFGLILFLIMILIKPSYSNYDNIFCKVK